MLNVELQLIKFIFLSFQFSFPWGVAQELKGSKFFVPDTCTRVVSDGIVPVISTCMNCELHWINACELTNH